jgi:hypothetical protein
VRRSVAEEKQIALPTAATRANHQTENTQTAAIATAAVCRTTVPREIQVKTLFLSLLLFALGCYQPPQIQYVPQPAPAPTPAPTIIEVPKDQPQPARPIIITPFGDRHRDFRHGTNEPAAPTKPAADNSAAPLATFVSAEVQIPREEIAELPEPPRDIAVSTSTSIDANQPAERSQSKAQPVKTKILALRARIRERLAERLHRSKR